MWPNGQGRLLRDVSTLSTLPRSKVVPLVYEDLEQWLCVDPCGTDTGCAAWIHPDAADSESRLEVTVRLQGFVELPSLGMLGNWDGYVHGLLL